MPFSNFLDDHVVRIAGWRRLFRAVVVSAVVLCAQSGDWARVRALTPGTEVEVKRFSAHGKVTAAVESATEEAIVLRRDAAVETYERTDIKRLRLVSTEKTTSGRITGTAILGGLGVVGVAVSDTQSGGSGAGRFLALPVYAGIGYLIGWAADGPKKITLYKGRKP